MGRLEDIGGSGEQLANLLKELLARVETLERTPRSYVLDGESISTQETRASAAYGDLATIGPSVGIPVGPSGRLAVFISADMIPGENSNGRMSYEIIGASNVPGGVSIPGFSDIEASDDRSAVVSGQAPGRGAYFHVHKDLTQGLYMVTAKYRNDGVSVNVAFRARELIVIPL